jgi:hypothetical protein
MIFDLAENESGQNLPVKFEGWPDGKALFNPLATSYASRARPESYTIFFGRCIDLL